MSEEKELLECMLCHAKGDKEDVKCLDLYVIGSEGCWACLACRMILTNVARGLMEVRGRVRLQIQKERS